MLCFKSAVMSNMRKMVNTKAVPNILTLFINKTTAVFSRVHFILKNVKGKCKHDMVNGIHT